MIPHSILLFVGITTHFMLTSLHNTSTLIVLLCMIIPQIGVLSPIPLTSMMLYIACYHFYRTREFIYSACNYDTSCSWTCRNENMLPVSSQHFIFAHMSITSHTLCLGMAAANRSQTGHEQNELPKLFLLQPAKMYCAYERHIRTRDQEGHAHDGGLSIWIELVLFCDFTPFSLNIESLLWESVVVRLLCVFLSCLLDDPFTPLDLSWNHQVCNKPLNSLRVSPLLWIL